jgi:hypothetical protein
MEAAPASQHGSLRTHTTTWRISATFRKHGNSQPDGEPVRGCCESADRSRVLLFDATGALAAADSALSAA